MCGLGMDRLGEDGWNCEGDEGGEGEKKLFLPLVNLVEQRPGVVPSL